MIKDIITEFMKTTKRQILFFEFEKFFLAKAVQSDE